MSRLFLLRHAKAGWAAPGMRDFDRPLEPRGLVDAAAVGKAMRARGYVPAKVTCSTARRATETWHEVSRHLGEDLPATAFTDRLYDEDAAGYAELVRQAGDPETLLVVGHNPMMEDLTIALAEQGDETALRVLGGGFPTAGLAVVAFDGPLSAAAPGKGVLEALLIPAEL